MEALENFEEDLLKNDKARKENRRGIQTICRMQGSITQSYFMLDQYEYRTARDIYYGKQVAGEVDHVDQSVSNALNSSQEIVAQKYNQNTQQIPFGVIHEQAEEQEGADTERQNQERRMQTKISRRGPLSASPEEN